MGYTTTLGRPGDLGTNNFSPVGNGLVSDQEVRNIYDRPPAERMWLMSRHKGYVSFATMLDAMGFSSGHDKPTTGHYEDPWQEDVVKINAVITPSAGAGTTEVWELHADSMYDTSQTVSTVAVQSSYVLVNDVIELFDRTQVRVESKDTSTTPHRITVKPLVATVNLAGKVTANDEYGILYNLFPEGSGLPSGRAPRIVKYTNTFGIIKHVCGSTGSELTNSVYHEVIPGQPGSAGDTIYTKVKYDELERYEMSKSGLLLFGQQPDNITDLPAGTNIDTSVYGTEGLIDFALTSGTIDTYTPGTYVLQDFDVIGDVYYDERVAKSSEIICWDGPDIATETENVLVDLMAQDLSPFVDRLVDQFSSYMSNGYQEGLDSSPADAVVSFGYSAVRKNGFTFHLKRLSEFNDVKRAGSASYGYRKYRIAMPVDWRTDIDSGEQRPTLGYEWKEKNGYSRQNVMGTISGAGVGGDGMPMGQAVHENDTTKFFLLSECAAHFAVGNGVVTQRPA